MTERTCARCGKAPSEVEFRKDKRARDGLGAFCKPCEKAYNREYYRKNKARLNAASASHYQANRDACLEQQRQYRRDNIDEIRAKDRARSRGNPIKVERSRQWRIDNPERFREVIRSWYRLNKDRHHHHVMLRRMRLLGNDGRVLQINRRVIWERDAGICGICRSPVPFAEMQLDHIIPIARGGPHVPDNVQPSHESCNRRKWAKMPT